MINRMFKKMIKSKMGEYREREKGQKKEKSTINNIKKEKIY